MLLLFDRTTKPQKFLRNMLSSLPHDLLQLTGMTLIPRLEKGVTNSALARTSRPANAVNIVLNRQRKGVVYDHFHIGDIQSTSSHIGGHQNGTAPILELRKSPIPSILCLIPMNGGAPETPPVQSPFQPRRLLLIQRKHQNAIILFLPTRVLSDQLLQTRLSRPILDHLHRLADTLIRRKRIIHGILPITPNNRFETHVNANGHDHKLQSKLLNRRRPRGRKHGRLPSLLCLTLGYDETHILLKPHIQHAVRLVQHQIGNFGEIAHPFVDQILQPPGSAHDAIDALAENVLLSRLGHSAVNDRGSQTDDASEFLEDFLGLHGEFAGGCEDEHAGGASAFVLE
mmetsp:Transcript_29379/g.61489  ORF Transcript_29379/g.61489 Transcript_29379/m.61489 type:complete len:342 (+) Transcript_29379:254-1279(+)